MHELGEIAVVGMALVCAITLAVLGDSPIVADALAGSGIGALAGTAHLIYRHRTGAPPADATYLIATWTLAGALAGLLVYLVAAVGFAP